MFSCGSGHQVLHSWSYRPSSAVSRTLIRHNLWLQINISKYLWWPTDKSFWQVIVYGLQGMFDSTNCNWSTFYLLSCWERFEDDGAVSLLAVFSSRDSPNGVEEIEKWLPSFHSLVVGPGLGREDVPLKNATARETILWKRLITSVWYLSQYWYAMQKAWISFFFKDAFLSESFL